MPRAGIPNSESLACPPPRGLTGPALLALLGLGDRGVALRRRLDAALHAHLPARWPAGDVDPASFGARLVALLSDEAGQAAYEAAAAAAEADLAPGERRLDLLAAARRRAFAALAEAAPNRAARARWQDGPLALAEAAAEATLWSEAALLLWRLAARPETAEAAARLAARYPALAEALPELAERARVLPVGKDASRRRLLRLMGFAEEGQAPLVPPANALAPRLEALGAERLSLLPADWRQSLGRLDSTAGLALADRIGAFERAALAAEARETALREAALQQTIDLVVVESALTELRRAIEQRETAWRAIADLLKRGQPA